MMDNNSKNSWIRQTLFLLLGEIAVSVIVVAFFLIFNSFSYKVVTGVILGSAVSVFNFLFLCISINRAVDAYLKERGSAEMTDEEAESFTEKHAQSVQNAAKISYIVRTVAMLVALVVAFILEWFNVLATVIPLLMYRPIMYVGELIRRKKGE